MNFAMLKKNSTAYLFLAPFIIGFLVFGLYPVVNTLTLSFTDTTLMSKNSHFVGLANFKRLFADVVFMQGSGQHLVDLDPKFYSPDRHRIAVIRSFHQRPAQDQGGRRLAGHLLFTEPADAGRGGGFVRCAVCLLRSSEPIPG